MKLNVYLNCTEDGKHYAYDHAKYREENIKTLTEAFKENKIPEEVHFINRIPEIDFSEELVFGNSEQTMLAVQLLLKDCLTEDSSVNRYFAKTGEEKGAAKKAAVALDILEGILNDEASNILKKKETVCYDVFYGNPAVDELEVLGGCSELYFKVDLPKESISKEDMRMFNAVESIKPEEMAGYVLPKYYLELAMWDREKQRSNKQRMDYLTHHCISTFFAALA